MKPQKNSFYVTTSIAYANAKPHVGYAMELIQADTLARYNSIRGKETYFLTGTDEHGQKLYDAAKSQSRHPKEYVDELSKTFVELAKSLQLRNDGFVRTTDPNHKAAAQKFWLACESDIYKGRYSGLYCIGCEKYYTETETTDKKCPIHKAKLKYLEIDSYFFSLSKYSKRLYEMIENNTLRIVPENRRNEMLSFIESGLDDISISRPKTQLEWGVEVPNDSENVMYVWFDALTNYISAIGYKENSDEFKQLWPADVHVVGKDIARFHCLLWPAMLMSAGLQIPGAIFVHSFITSDGHKMSKSLGNVVDPIEYLKMYGVEAVRYYLLRYIPSYDDGDFTKQRFEEVYNADLANTLGNLVSRLGAMLQKYNGGQYIKVKSSAIDIEELMNDFRFDRCLEQIFQRLSILNVTIDQEKPWELYRTDQEKTKGILNSLTSELLTISEALRPFLPETSRSIDKIFNDGRVSKGNLIIFPRID